MINLYKVSFTLLFICIQISNAQSQNFLSALTSKLPLVTDYNQKELVLQADLNNDGIDDYFLVQMDAANEMQSHLHFITLLSHSGVLSVADDVRFSKQDFTCCTQLKWLSNGKMLLTKTRSDGGEEFTAQWDKQRNKFRIIRYRSYLKSPMSTEISTIMDLDLMASTLKWDISEGDEPEKLKSKKLPTLEVYYLSDLNKFVQKAGGLYMQRK